MIFKLLAKIYTAGENFEEARPKIAILVCRGFKVTSDILGEFTKDLEKIKAIISEYKEHIKDLSKEQSALGLRCLSLAIKPSRIGLEISREVFEENLEYILKEAKKFGIFVWVDAEKKKDRETVSDVVIKTRSLGYRNIGLALQSVHSDAKKFLYKLLEWAVPMRLVKGAYTDGDLKKKEDIDKNLKDLFWTALTYYKNVPLEKRAVVAMGTNDAKLIDYALAFEKDRDLKSFIQIQMLYGIQVKLQRELARAHKNILIYVPIGRDYWGFLMRRLKEGIRPSAIWLFLRNIVEAIRYR